MTTHQSDSPERTRELGRLLAAHVRPGDLVLLTGELGAGKTTFVQGLARGLGVPGRVLSPTFVIARVHRGGRIPLVHADAYRLGAAADPRAELDDLDLDAELDDSVVVIEWGEGVAEQLAAGRISVRIELADGRRTITWSSTDGRELP